MKEKPFTIKTQNNIFDILKSEHRFFEMANLAIGAKKIRVYQKNDL